MSTRHSLWSAVPAVVAVMVVAPMEGCEKKLTTENLAQIKNGMTLDEVEHILGKGSEVTDGTASSVAAGMVNAIPGAGAKAKPIKDRRVYQWKEDRKELTVTFEDGKVVDKGSFGM